VFVAIATLYMQRPMRLDYLWAALCQVAAACFIFRT